MTEGSNESTTNTTFILGLFGVCVAVVGIFLMTEAVSEQSRNDQPPLLTFSVDDPDVHFHYFESIERRLLKSTNSARAVPHEHRRWVFVTKGDHSDPLNRDFVYVTNLDEKHGFGQHQAHRLQVEQALITLDIESEARKQQPQEVTTPARGQGLSDHEIEAYRNEMESIEVDPNFPGRMGPAGQIPDPSQFPNPPKR